MSLPQELDAKDVMLEAFKNGSSEALCLELQSQVRQYLLYEYTLQMLHKYVQDDADVMPRLGLRIQAVPNLSCQT